MFRFSDTLFLSICKMQMQSSLVHGKVDVHFLEQCYAAIGVSVINPLTV